MEDHFDLIVIGSGPGGYVAALRAAKLGLKTACVDKRPEPGGTCLNIGCIPSKCLLHSTEQYYLLKNFGPNFGLEFSELNANFPVMNKRKKEVVKGLVNGVKNAFKEAGVSYIVGEATFLNANQVEITNNGTKQTLTAKYLLIATGSTSTPLPELPFDEKNVLSSTGVLSLNAVPKSLLVIGGGVIGVELASIFARLGTQITVIEMLDRICPAMDAKISAALLQSLKNLGIKFYLNATLITSVIQPNEVIVTVNHDDKLSNFSAEKMLVAVGRRPYTERLGLEKAGVEDDKKGYIPVNHSFQTSQKHIFAIGDVIEGTMLAHRASEEGVAVVELIANKNPKKLNYMSIPNVIYTHPEVAAVGLTEEEARQAGINVQVGISYFKANGRARCSGEMEGFVKIIGDAKTGRLLGMHIIGSHASELIAEGMMAIQKEATLSDIAYAPNAHPTLSEVIKEAALSGLKVY